MANTPPFLTIDGKYVTKPAFSVKPLDGYKIPENEATGKELPNCCDFHGSLFTQCFNSLKGPDSANLTRKIVLQVSYTEHTIAVSAPLDSWFKDIADYIDCNVQSFGSPSHGASYYLSAIKHFIKECKPKKYDFSKEKRAKLISYIEENYNNVKPKEMPDLNQLYITYQKWLNLFPFNIKYFSEIKQHFAHQMPFLSEAPEVNKYTGIAKVKIITKDNLIVALTQTTKELLKHVTDSIRNVPDIDQHTFELISERHRIKQESLFTDIAPREKKYLKIVEKWLTNEKEYFIDIAPIFDKGYLIENRKIESKESILQTRLNEHGFFELSAVKNLSNPNQLKLISSLTKNSTPYIIAMLKHLGFIQHLLESNNHTNYKVYKIIAKIFNNGKNERLYKGNIAVLSEKTNEHKGRFTAHKHTETVKKDYELLI